MKSAFITLLFILTCIATQAKLVTIIWDDPNNAPQEVDGYNLYQASTIPVPNEPTIYIKVNTDPILEKKFTHDVLSGQIYVLRAFNSMGESVDSNPLIIPNVPNPPVGAKLLVVMVQESTDLSSWNPIAMIMVAADVPRKFFRIAW